MNDFLNNLPEGIGLLVGAVSAVSAFIGWVAKSIFKRKK